MKNYEQPVINIVVINTNDIVTASGGWFDVNTNDYGGAFKW